MWVMQYKNKQTNLQSNEDNSHRSRFNIPKLIVISVEKLFRLLPKEQGN